MVMIWILLSLVLAYIFGKWVLLLFLSPLILFDMKRKRKKSAIIQRQDEEYLKNENHKEEFVVEQGENQNIIKKVLTRILSLLEGFERYILFKIGYLPSHRLRNFLYRHIFLVKMSKGAVIYYGAEIRGSYNLILERGAVVGDRCVLDARRGHIKIGKNVQLGNGVNLWTGSHDYNDPLFRSMPGKRGPIEIEDYAWIGPGTTILHSVCIGRGAVVGAGSIVTKDVSSKSVVAGIPAKKVSERHCEPIYDLSKSHIPIY